MSPLRSRTPVVLATLALLSCTAAQQAARAREAIGAPPHDVRQGKYTLVRCYFDNAAACVEASALADAAYEQACAYLNVPLEAPPHLLEIELVASKRDLSSVNTELGIKPMQGSKGFSANASEAIYLACESCTPQHALPGGLIGWDRASIAHEVLHLTNTLRFDNSDFELPWLTEGQATDFEEQFMRRRGAFADANEASAYAMRMSTAQKLLAAGKVPRVADIISTPLEEVAPQPRYAMWWLFYRFMDEEPRRTRFRAFLRWLQTAPLRNYHHVAYQFAEAFPPEALDAGFAVYLRGLKPAWAAGVVDTLGDGWAQAVGPRGAPAWRTPGHDPDAVQGEVTRVHGKSPAMLLYGTPQKTCFGVELIGRRGIAVLVPPPPSPGKHPPWRVVASAPAPAPLQGQAVPFRVDVTGGKVFVQEGGQTVVAEEPACAAPSAWALFSGSLTTNLWRQMQFTAPVAPALPPAASIGDGGQPAELAPAEDAGSFDADGGCEASVGCVDAP